MINNFENLFEHVRLFEHKTRNVRVGLYPGAFKPPHIGHYTAALENLKKNDIVYVIISGQSRGKGEDKITADESEKIWNLYRTYNGDSNLRIIRADNHNDSGSGAVSTVITATYDAVHLLNNKGEYTPTSKFTEPHPAAQQIYTDLKSFDICTVRVHAGREDFKGRYSGFPFDGDDKDKRYIGKGVDKVIKGTNKRLASASSIRPYIASYRGTDIKTSNDVREKILAGALKYDDFSSIRKNLPGDDDLKDAVIDVLLS